jgi:hypothetical protein
MPPAPLFLPDGNINGLFRFWGILIILVLAYLAAKEWHKRGR